jgi:hypothetical protein
VARYNFDLIIIQNKGRRGRVRMVAEFLTTYAISAYHYLPLR